MSLEKYRGMKSRHICPGCGYKEFVRYIGSGGSYISEAVGRCNRLSKCGYHKKPKDYFLENPNLSNLKETRTKKKARLDYGFAQQEVVTTLPKQSDYIEQSYLLRTLAGYEQNAFVQFLLNLFSEDSPEVWKTIKDYFIGTSRDGKTVFWQIDRNRRVRTGKLIAYDMGSGKRRKDIFPNWIHSELKKSGHLKEDFNLKQCFFGEHLLNAHKEKSIAVVEAEKTAVIASICFPELIWLAVGSKQNLSVGKLQRLSGRKIVLYPDGDGFAPWTEIAKAAQLHGLTVKVSFLIEANATTEQKTNGYDLADYLIAEQTRINEHNLFADQYNAKVDYVLSDDEFFAGFNEILNEQKAILSIDGEMSETEAESRILQTENIRQIIWSL